MTTYTTLARAARLGAARKRGVTLIEAVLYISIALALIVGGLVFFQQASLAQRTNSAVRNISAIASETRGLYQSSQNFKDVEAKTLINAGAVPTSIIDGEKLKNEWNGEITIAANQITTANDSFSVVYASVPTSACARLGSSDATGAGRVGSGIFSVGFRKGGTSAAFDITAASTGDLTPAFVATECDDAADGGSTVDLRYVFTR
jgi:hypothetical protein